MIAPARQNTPLSCARCIYGGQFYPLIATVGGKRFKKIMYVRRGLQQPGGIQRGRNGLRRPALLRWVIYLLFRQNRMSISAACALATCPCGDSVLALVPLMTPAPQAH